jgi:uncharacterized membrane protein HdeD (DUF308 family)
MSSTETSETPSGDVRRIKLWLWIAGVATIVLGAVGIFSPFLLTLAAELLFGAVLAALGAVQIVRALFSGDVGSRLWTLLFGAVSLAGGVLLLLYPLEGILTLTIVLALFFVAGGIVKLFGAWQMRTARMRHLGMTGEVPGRGWLAVAGALSLLLGLLLLFGLPPTAAWALGLLLGIDLLFLGFAEIALAMGLDGDQGEQASA